ncbi:unnamed protein product [Macrosiphum euphorbiae]|uniref:Uncharacterized protein n=1 Tax=Macrosiphum euphorbiae TaxID=13131 RepID=A0AAV0WCY0_9HEMI|nr:unnamed protein product [Macrosiphum euphorbiae]
MNDDVTLETTFFGDDHSDLQDVQINEIQYETVFWKDIKVGKFLLVNFIGGYRKKTLFKYVCLVQSVDDDDGDVIVQGLKQEDCIGTQFSINDGEMSTYYNCRNDTSNSARS